MQVPLLFIIPLPVAWEVNIGIAMDGGKCCANSFSPEIQWTPDSERSSTLTPIKSTK
jgi:hypothetical protein